LKTPLVKTSRGLLASRAGRWLFAALVALALVILILGRVEHPAVVSARSAVTDAARPVLDVLSRPLARIDAALDWVGRLGNLATENRRLREENARLRRWQATALALERENDRLRVLLDAPRLDVAPVATARVIGMPGGPFVRSVVIDAGRRDGVRVNQPVLDQDGLVGRIFEAGEKSARVLLITDLNSRVPVRLPARNVNAIARGRNDDLIEVAFLGPDARLAAGDHAVTTGDGGVFPPDIPVGRVAEADATSVTLRPAALFDRLEFVQVVRSVQETLTSGAREAESAGPPDGPGDGR